MCSPQRKRQRLLINSVTISPLGYTYLIDLWGWIGAIPIQSLPQSGFEEYVIDNLHNYLVIKENDNLIIIMDNYSGLSARDSIFHEFATNFHV